jgi:membrane-anchored mycosin MYCP
VLHGLVAGLVLAGAGVVVFPAPAAAQATCNSDPPQGQRLAEEPWEEGLFDLDRLSPVPDGRGVTVAVIDTGVDASHPQLDNAAIQAGQDFVPEGGPDAQLDCDGHGTAVASIIVAAPEESIGFAGLAPRATILPARITESRSDDIEAATVADAIEWATDQGADIINLSLVFYRPNPRLEEAVNYAVARDVIVVAAAGNEKAESGVDPPAFPAVYNGVVSVGSITRDGLRDTSTHVGLDVDLLAPGQEVTVAWPGGERQLQGGTSFAAAFVSAAAALVRSENPDLSGPEVVALLRANADPAPGLFFEPNVAGIVNPYAALTGRVVDEPPVAIQPAAEPPVDPVAQARAERWERTVQRALLIVLIAVSLTALGIMGAAIWRRGQRNRWLPGQRRDPVFPHPMVDEPERLFYTVPTPRSRR